MVAHLTLLVVSVSEDDLDGEGESEEDERSQNGERHDGLERILDHGNEGAGPVKRKQGHDDLRLHTQRKNRVRQTTS